MYDDTYTKVYAGRFLDEYEGEEAELMIIGEESFENRKQFIGGLKDIPNGCLSIGSLEAYMKVGIITVPLNVYHCVIIGKSGNGNPYIIDGQSKNKAQGIYRGLDEIYAYLKSGDYIFMRYLTNDSKICGKIDKYNIEKEGSNPFDDEIELERTKSLTMGRKKKKRKKKKKKKKKPKKNKTERNKRNTRRKISKNMRGT